MIWNIKYYKFKPSAKSESSRIAKNNGNYNSDSQSSLPKGETHNESIDKLLVI